MNLWICVREIWNFLFLFRWWTALTVDPAFLWLVAGQPESVPCTWRPNGFRPTEASSRNIYPSKSVQWQFIEEITWPPPPPELPAIWTKWLVRWFKVLKRGSDTWLSYSKLIETINKVNKKREIHYPYHSNWQKWRSDWPTIASCTSNSRLWSAGMWLAWWHLANFIVVE